MLLGKEYYKTDFQRRLGSLISQVSDYLAICADGHPLHFYKGYHCSTDSLRGDFETFQPKIQAIFFSFFFFFNGFYLSPLDFWF